MTPEWKDAFKYATTLADQLGFKYYAFVSQVERGYGRLPMDKIAAWARAVGSEPQPFAQRLISYYEPELHRVLYEPPRPRRSPPGPDTRTATAAE